MELFYHPLSSYSWKALIALYERDIPFTCKMLEEPGVAAQWMDLWPIARFPVLRDGDRIVAEASIIVEYLDRKGTGPFMPIPADPDEALEARLMDRLFDNYVMGPLQTAVSEKIRPPHANRDPWGVDQARAMLAKAYDLIEARIAERAWAAGPAFSLADCAAAPSLFYADHILPFRASHPALGAYMARLEARPSVARVIEEMRPWFHHFPFADAREAG
jgi:glutathione S-transferase